MKQSILISGSGGQGVISAGILIAQSAADSGKYASFLPNTALSREAAVRKQRSYKRHRDNLSLPKSACTGFA